MTHPDAGTLPLQRLEPSEVRRLAERDQGLKNWSLWGSYLSDRQWGTVREDYSADGNAWVSFPHDHARSRTYRWGEDGLLGICDEQCRLCFSVSLWNGKDSILKERPFGLGNPEGNHGEDLKDYYYHLANTPTHSFMRGLYKYPQAPFPYEHLVEENGRRNREEPEYELVDTGIFDDHAYFDVVLEYAKASPTDLLIRIRVVNRGSETAPLVLLPTLWLRNTWAWGYPDQTHQPIQLEGDHLVTPDLSVLPSYECFSAEEGPWLFTENETNSERLFGIPNTSPYQKDAFHRWVIDGETTAVNPAQRGTKAAQLLRRDLAPGEEWVVALRLRERGSGGSSEPFGPDFDQIFTSREQEWRHYFDHIAPGLGDDDRLIHTAATAGLLWCKKYYGWSVLRWLEGDPNHPAPPPERWHT